MKSFIKVIIRSTCYIVSIHSSLAIRQRGVGTAITAVLDSFVFKEHMLLLVLCTQHHILSEKGFLYLKFSLLQEFVSEIFYAVKLYCGYYTFEI